MNRKIASAIGAAIALVGLGFAGGLALSGGESDHLSAQVQVFSDEDFSGAFRWLPIEQIQVALPLPNATACSTSIPGAEYDWYVPCGTFIEAGGKYEPNVSA